jgi:hypothetical protein
MILYLALDVLNPATQHIDHVVHVIQLILKIADGIQFGFEFVVTGMDV